MVFTWFSWVLQNKILIGFVFSKQLPRIRFHQVGGTAWRSRRRGFKLRQRAALFAESKAEASSCQALGGGLFSSSAHPLGPHLAPSKVRSGERYSRQLLRGYPRGFSVLPASMHFDASRPRWCLSWLSIHRLSHKHAPRRAWGLWRLSIYHPTSIRLGSFRPQWPWSWLAFDIFVVDLADIDTGCLYTLAWSQEF